MAPLDAADGEVYLKDFEMISSVWSFAPYGQDCLCLVRELPEFGWLLALLGPVGRCGGYPIWYVNCSLSPWQLGREKASWNGSARDSGSTANSA